MPESTCHSVSSIYSQGPQSQPKHNWFLTHTCKYDFQKLQSHSYSVKLGKEHWRSTCLISQEVPRLLSFIIFNILAYLLPKSQYSESQDKLLSTFETPVEKVSGHGKKDENGSGLSSPYLCSSTSQSYTNVRQHLASLFKSWQCSVRRQWKVLW